MSQIANLILIENGKHTVYYDHWAGYTIDQYLLWGPEINISFFREHKAENYDDWSPYVQAGALIDVDKKVLLFYGGALYFDPELFPLYRKILAITWKDYDVRFAYNGLIDLFNYLEIVDHRFEQKLSYPPLPDDAIANYFKIYDDFDSNFYTGLLSLETSQGIKLIPLYMPFIDDTEFLFAGNNFIDYAAKFKGISAQKVRELFDRDGFPELGIHADYTTKTLYFWQNGMGFLGDIDYETLKERWNDWTLESLYRDALKHLALINEPMLFPLHRETEQLAHIKEIVMIDYDNTPTLLEEAVAEMGEEVLLHPDAKKFIPFTLPMTEQKRIFVIIEESILHSK